MPRKVAYIHTLLRSCCFYEVADLVQDDPDQAAALNSAKSSPLAVLVKSATWGTVQTAICHNDPTHVEGFEEALDALVTACPEAVAHRNKNGDTPLMLACRDGHIAHTPMFAQQSSACCDLLKWAVDRMIDACPAAAAVRDSEGTPPIDHVLDQGYGPMDVAVKLVRAHPDSLLQGSNGFGGSVAPVMVGNINSADCCLWERVKTLVSLVPSSAVTAQFPHCNAIQQLWFKIRNRPDYVARHQPGVGLPHIPDWLSDDMIVDIANKMTSSDGQDHEFYSRALDLLLFLLKAGYHNRTTIPADNEEDDFSAAHAAAGLIIPSEALRMIVTLFPDQVTSIDDNGRLPLHIAAAGPGHSRGFDEIDHPTGVEVLVQADPDAVRVLDRSGNLPLHLALQNRHLPPSLGLGIKALVQADPRTLRIANGTGAFPFLLAATAARDRDGLDLVYQLLRADPAVMRLATHGSHGQD